MLSNWKTDKMNGRGPLSTTLNLFRCWVGVLHIHEKLSRAKVHHEKNEVDRREVQHYIMHLVSGIKWDFDADMDSKAGEMNAN